MADADALRDAGVTGVPGAPEPAPPPAAAPEGAVMSLVDHLSELRNRLFKVILAVADRLVGRLDLRDRTIRELPDRSPCRNAAGLDHPTVQVLGLGDAFFIQLRISIVVGVILAMPVILYQLWAFVAPGLTPSEKKTIRPWVPLALLFFAIGVAIAYVVLPFAVGFLLAFTDEHRRGRASPPVRTSTSSRRCSWPSGSIMEFPIIMVGLSQGRHPDLAAAERVAPDDHPRDRHLRRRRHARAATS